MTLRRPDYDPDDTTYAPHPFALAPDADPSCFRCGRDRYHTIGAMTDLHTDTWTDATATHDTAHDGLRAPALDRWTCARCSAENPEPDVSGIDYAQYDRQTGRAVYQLTAGPVAFDPDETVSLCGPCISDLADMPAGIAAIVSRDDDAACINCGYTDAPCATCRHDRTEHAERCFGLAPIFGLAVRRPCACLGYVPAD